MNNGRCQQYFLRVLGKPVSEGITSVSTFGLPKNSEGLGKISNLSGSYCACGLIFFLGGGGF
jgi:hypothetical protein